jgi:hypothetical protein
MFGIFSGQKSNFKFHLISIDRVAGIRVIVITVVLGRIWMQRFPFLTNDARSILNIQEFELAPQSGRDRVLIIGHVRTD